ncbi:MAG: holo-[acyl-carrier protein] synthase [Rickettsiales bacterium]|jgi:holo-[acyl-carrier protein] synthase
MILGLGLDIVKTSRIDAIYSKLGNNFLDRIFAKSEIDRMKYFSSNKKKLEFLSKRFAAKEAFSKALGVGIGQIKFNEIEIYNDQNGKPEIRKTAKINLLVKDLFTVKDYQINLSITDDAGIAQAIVILSKK